MGKPYDFEQKARAAVISDWLDDDEAAMAHAEEQARHLAVHVWARWLRAISSEPIPALRVDFLVGHAAPGRATVRSLELTELGFCMLGWKEGPRLVMGALLESCLEVDTVPIEADAEGARVRGGGMGSDVQDDHQRAIE
jgi:hypothetical protein